MRAYYRRPGQESAPPPADLPALRQKRRRKRAKWGFLIALGILILGCAAALLVHAVLPESGNGMNTGRPPASSDTAEDREDFIMPTIPTGGNGSGVTLTLHDAGEGTRLSYNQVYEKNIQSITSIYVTDNYSAAGYGTGVIMTEDGYIITNAHVVSGMSTAYVTTYAGSTMEAQLVGCDRYSDLAVLKVEPQQPLVPAEFGSSDTLAVGDTALALGNPLGTQLWGTMTNGIISAINRDVDMGSFSMTLIQTTAALNSGNSGGALLNSRGQVVGITNMKLMSDSNTIEGLGFAIPSTTVKLVVDALIAQGSYNGSPSIGITGYASDDPEHPGVVVYSMDKASTAYKRGLQLGDIITAVDGTAVSTVQEINEIKGDKGIGDELVLSVFRPGTGEELTISITLIGSYDLNG